MNRFSRSSTRRRAAPTRKSDSYPTPPHSSTRVVEFDFYRVFLVPRCLSYCLPGGGDETVKNTYKGHCLVPSSCVCERYTLKYIIRGYRLGGEARGELVCGNDRRAPTRFARSFFSLFLGTNNTIV